MLPRKQLVEMRSYVMFHVWPILIQTCKLPNELKRFILLVVILVFIIFVVYPAVLRNNLIMEPTSNQKVGRIKRAYIDKNGKVVIDASKYDRVHKFSDGLAAVNVVGKGWGFIDRAGNEVIKPQYESVKGFSDGLAEFMRGWLWGYIDKSGREVIKPQYNASNKFSEGVAVVLDGNDLGVINKSGQLILSQSLNGIELNIEDARFVEGVLAVEVKSKAGFIDKSGTFIIDPKFENAAPFSEGLARATIRADGEEKVGFIDHGGQFVIPPIFNTDEDFRRNSSDFSEGVAGLTEGLRPTITEEAKFVYIDKMGKIVHFTKFFYAGPFRDGLAVVWDEGTRKSGYINKSGKIVIPLKYDTASDFSEGLAVVGI